MLRRFYSQKYNAQKFKVHKHNGCGERTQVAYSPELESSGTSPLRNKARQGSEESEEFK